MRVAVLLLVLAIRLIRGLREEGKHTDEGSHGLWYLLCILGLVFTVAAIGNTWFAVPAVAMYVLMFPWVVTRYALIPLGLCRPAYHLTRMAEWVWGKDARGGAAVAGAWAVLRKRHPDPTSIEWIEQRVAQSGRIGGAQILATGLLCAARGDDDTARSLLESVESLDRGATPSMGRRLANDWLVAEAAGRGGRSSARSEEHDAPGDNRLSRLWMGAAARRATRSLVLTAISSHRDRGDGDVPAETAAEADAAASYRDSYADALDAHVLALCGDPATRRAADLARLGRAWDRALHAPDTRIQILTRGAALGAREPSAVIDELGATVATDIANMARAARLSVAELAGDSRILHEAARLLRDELMSEVDFAFDTLGNRVREGRNLAPIDEWREWLALRALHERTVALGGFELRRLAFPHVHTHVCSLAVWLWNERHQNVIATARFSRLLAEASAVGDAEAIELQSNNARLSP